MESSNVSAVLFNDGRIRFDYGVGNAGLTPTVGLSMGDGEHVRLVPGYDGAASLTSAGSVSFNLAPGTVDVGAYEFRGRSDDATPPAISATTPAGVGAAGQAPGDLRQIGLTFTEPLNTPDARATANYRLVGAGPDGALGTSDDVIYPLTPRFAQGSNSVTLDVGGVPAGRGLPAGTYRLTVFGGTLTAVHDLSGLPLDGDGNGTGGGDYVRVFTVGASDAAAPRVAAVWADGTGWSSSFRSFLQTTGVGNSVFGFAVPVGAAQTLALPWTNVNRFRVRFSEAVNVAQGDFKLFGVNVADYPVASFAYNPATFTATWTLVSPVKADKVSLRLASGLAGAAGVKDLAGNGLDGEWNNAAGAFPSGDGSPGGVFAMRLNVLPGDANRDGRVTPLDLLRARVSVGRSTTNRGAGTSAYSAFNDVDGDGRISAVDVALINARSLTRLPSADPAALPAALFGARPIEESAAGDAASDLLTGL